MKKLFFIPVVALMLLSACSTYQINTVKSINTPVDDKTGMFKFENDSVKIVYSFAGENAPIHIDVYNKLNQPMYIDWERSAYIAGEKSYSYADETVQINGDVSGTSVGKNITFSSGSINAQATLPKNVTFVPPHVKISKTVLSISKQAFNAVPEGEFVKTTLPSSFGSSQQKVNIARFTPANSPLNFKSYLTTYVLEGNTPKLTAYQSDFYVSEILRASVNPDEFVYYPNARGDFFTGTGAGN